MKRFICLAVCSMLLGTTLAVKVNIEAKQPQGIKFSVPDEGYSMVGLHYSINKDLPGVAAGDINVDIKTKTGSDFIYEDTKTQLKPGDKINYWVLSISKANGEGVQALDQTFVYTGPTTTTSKPTATTTTPKPTAKQPAPTLSKLLNGTKPSDSGSTTNKTSNPQNGTLSSTSESTNGSTNTGSSNGTSKPNHVASVAYSGSTGTSQNGSTASSSSTASTGSQQAKVVCAADPYNKESSCTSYPCLIFEDEFDKLDAKLWEHEITAGGGGNWEFQHYTNNRSNSYTKDGKLFIKPTLTTDRFGPQFLEHGHLNIWGTVPADVCTGNNFYGCERQGMPGQVLNPVQSARLRSSRYFNFKYGRLEVEAKMPTGDWLWPAIWLLPRWNFYGSWPASGEIDLVESRGNLHYKDDKGQPAGVESVGSTLHFGPFVEANQWPKAHATTTASSGTFADSFHKFTLDWDENSLRFSVDGKEILNVDPPTGGFWKLGEFEKNGESKWNNPWAGGTHMAPFDQEFFIIMNVAVGGVGFFPDNYVNSPYPKPWNDHAGHAATAFWNARNNWLPTWNLDKNDGEDAAMQVKYIKVWKMKPNP